MGKEEVVQESGHTICYKREGAGNAAMRIKWVRKWEDRV